MSLFKGVKVKCRNCGHDADSNEFVLDPGFKMVVCPNCVKERKAKSIASGIRGKGDAREAQKAQSEGSPLPPGWDQEDEYLQRFAKAKKKSTIRAQRIDEEHVKFNCPKCSYEIKYNTVKNTPARCPYCSTSLSGN